ncbi:hypothetical protein EYF80_006971 [Liparis tanakae]|uniref:Uncharacterized protein n=1 Tax=Liparis tanakae TaxID=230148 RepID=A0A4Z2IXN3_9TELE|nr:hypothetical protein EYF80_006971 [Liparis tanakae]
MGLTATESPLSSGPPGARSGSHSVRPASMKVGSGWIQVTAGIQPHSRGGDALVLSVGVFFICELEAEQKKESKRRAAARGVGEEAFLRGGS